MSQISYRGFHRGRSLPKAQGGFAGVLDGLSSASYAAHGFHLLTKEWIDNAVCRLREDNTNSEDDFFANTAGVLSNASGQSVTDWLTANGASNAFVDSIYDQTGNSRHWTQTTNANQPGFSLTGFNGRPAATFNGSSQYMIGTNLHQPVAGSSSPYTTVVAASLDDLAAAHCFAHFGNSGNAQTSIYHGFASSSIGFRSHRRDDAGPPLLTQDYLADTEPYLHLFRHNGANIDIYRDDVLVVDDGAFSVGTLTANITTFGASRLGGTLANYMSGALTDFLLFDSAISDDDVNRILS